MKYFILLLTIQFSFQLIGQTDFGTPELDDNLLQSKQHKRLVHFEENRNTAAKSDQLKYALWESLPLDESKDDEELWVNFGPDTLSGRIISISFHPTDPNTFLVGAASGGLWRTENYGESWTCLTDEFYTMGIGAVAYNPENPNTILIATGEGYDFSTNFVQGFGTLISYDGGENWAFTELAAGYDQNFAGMDIYWNPEDTSKVVVSSSFGVYFSSNGGLNYTGALDRIGGRMVVDPQNASRLYFGARYYNADFPGGFYISEDSGESWLLSGTGSPIPAHFGFTSITVHPVSNNIIYMTVAQSPVEGSGPMKGIYKSVDYGENFTEIVSSRDVLCYPEPYADICQGWFANTILVDPDDTNILYAGGTRLWKSINGGLDWEATDLNEDMTAHAIHADHHQTLFHPLTGHLFDCNDGGVNYSSDGGETWTSISNGLITHQFYSLTSSVTNPEIVIGGTQDVGTFTSTTAHEGGWKNPVGGDSFEHVISHSDEDVWYGTHYTTAQRFRTENAGDSWEIINTGTTEEDQWLMQIEMHPENSEILLTSDNSFTYKSTNGGDSWSAVASFGFLGNIEYDNQNPEIVYAGQLFGSQLYRSTNGGDDWSVLPGSPGGPITDIISDPLESGKIYLTIGSFGEDEQVFVSENAGETWVNISNNLPEIPTNSLAISPYNNQEIYVANDFGVWVSVDGGSNYEAFNGGLPSAIVVADIHYSAPDSTVRIGTYGRGYWKTKGRQTVFTSLQEAASEKVFVYPNPSNGIFFLSAPIGTYTIYDQMGQMVIQQNDLRIDLGKLPTGVYLLVSADYQQKLVRH